MKRYLTDITRDLQLATENMDTTKVRQLFSHERNYTID